MSPAQFTHHVILIDDTSIRFKRSPDGISCTVISIVLGEVVTGELETQGIGIQELQLDRLNLSDAGYRFDPVEGGPIVITLDIESDGTTTQAVIYNGRVREIPDLYPAA